MNDDSALDKAQDIISDRQYQIITVLTIITLTTGTIFYHLVEKLSWADAIYFSVITLTTVGYGDIAPVTPVGKIFTCFYILFGIGIIVAFTSKLLKKSPASKNAQTLKTQISLSRVHASGIINLC